MTFDTGFEVSDLKSLKKKYKGVHLSLDVLAETLNGYYYPDLKEIEIEFSHTLSWNCDYVTYRTEIILDDNGTVKNIRALQCEVLLGDDARGSSYRNKRADDYDYWLLDSRLEKAVLDEKI